MFEQIKNISSVKELLGYLKETFIELVGNIGQYFNGANNVRMASVVLIVLAFVLFVFLLAIIHMKSIVSFIKINSSGDSAALRESYNNDWDDDFPDRRLEEILEDSKEKAAAAENEKNKIIKEEKQKKLILRKEEEEKEKEQELQRKKVPVVALDWEKKKIKELESAIVMVNGEVLKYKPTKKLLNELTGLIIDMISRGVDELKIAQTVMFRTQGEVSEDEILQTIDAIKDFIALSVSKRFESLRKTKNLPDEKEAISKMADGNASYALGLLEALMDQNINLIAKTTSEQKRKSLVAETSFVAIMFGNLASLSDSRLAKESFELAIDLFPKNVNAWGRVADMYYKTENHQKAIDAYKKLLELADEEVYPRQVANAHRMLAQYYYEQGDNTKASKLFNSSKKYYDYIGINKNLERQELEVVEIIESRQQEELQNAIVRIFNSKNWQLSYA